MKTIHSDRAICSIETTKVICNIDATALGDTNYTASNLTGYYVAINAWVLLIRDTGNVAVSDALLRYMRGKGLLATIAFADSTANYIISVANGTPSYIVDDDIIALESAFTTHDLRVALQVLRFLKRFTPYSQHLLTKAAEGFLAIQDKLNWRKHIDRVDNTHRDVLCDPIPPYDYVVLDMVRPYVSEMTKFWKVYWETETGSFSNGACADAKTLVAKCKALAKYQSNFDWEYYPIKPIGDTSCVEFVAPKLTVKAVPKNYKQGRLIAPEPAYVNWHGNRLRKALEASLRASRFGELINLKSQSGQHDRAFIGSLTGALATIDSSAASDSIARYVMRYLLDDELYKLIEKWLPKKYLVGGRTVTAATFLTSGNPCTFILESIFFLAVAFAARDLHWKHTGVMGEWPTSFGDDLEVDVKYVDETICLLERLGIKVNVDKSFSSGYYRESCGVEYFRGEPVKSIYWPRKEVLTTWDVQPSDYAELVKLQHRVFNYTTCSQFICDVVTSYWPATTFSQPSLDSSEFDNYGDLWGIGLQIKKKERPHGAYWRDEDCTNFQYKPEYKYLTGHTQVCLNTSKHDNTTLSGAYDEAIADMYEYQQWLKHGPRYESDYDRAYGVSSRRSFGNVYETPKTTVKVKYS